MEWKPVEQQKREERKAARSDVHHLAAPLLAEHEGATIGVARAVLFSLVFMAAGLLFAIFLGLAAGRYQVFRTAMICDFAIGGLAMLYIAWRELGLHFNEREARLSLIYKLEETFGDINGDGTIGKPAAKQEPDIIYFNGALPGAQAAPAIEPAPATNHRFYAFLQDVYACGTPERTPVGTRADGKPLLLKDKYAGEYEEFRDRLIEWHVAEWQSDGNHLLGWRLVLPLQAIMGQLQIQTGK